LSYVDKFYIIYIEPLPFGFKNDLAAMKIIQPTPEGGGHVEDKFVLLKVKMTSSVCGALSNLSNIAPTL